MANYDAIVKQFQEDVTSQAVGASSFSETNRTILKYPLNNQDDYGGTITFRARTPAYDTLGAKAFEFLAPEFQAQGNIAEQSANGAGDTAAAQQIAAAKKAVSVEKQFVTTSVRKEIGSGRKCTLYLPGAIQIQDRVTYSNVDLGVLGAGIRAGIQSDQTAGELVSGAFGALADNFGSVIKVLTSAESLARSEEAQIVALRALKGSSVASGAISSATGIALNPNRRAVLSGPELRSFSFSFRLVPTSQAEAVAIEKIIQFFREEMYPEAIVRAGVSAAFKYPAIFDIIMRYKTSDGTYKKVATQVLPSFLQSVDVNYNQSGMSFHRDGRPQEATLTLNFTEERTLNKYDVAVRGY